MFKKLVNLKLKFTKIQKGLTLIELLVLLFVILGIIAAIQMQFESPMVMSNIETMQYFILISKMLQFYRMLLIDIILCNSTSPGALENLTKLPISRSIYKGGPYIKSVPSVENTKKCTVTTFIYSRVDSGKVSLAEAFTYQLNLNL